MRETFTSGAVGRVPGNRCLYPEPDCLQHQLLCRFRQQVSAGVTPHKLECPARDEEVHETHTSSSLTTVGPMHFRCLKKSAPSRRVVKCG